MVDRTENGAAKVVGKVAGMEGYVYVIDSDGTRRLIEAGEEIRLGQTLETLGGSAIVVTLGNDKSFSLGQNQELTVDQRLIKLLEEIEEEGSLEEAINFDLIAQAFESGQSIDEILPAPAAGGDNAPTSSSSAGVSVARIERTGGEVTPESGFDTYALVNGANDFNLPSNRDGFNQFEIIPSGNSRPVTFGIDDFSVDQDQKYTLDLSRYFSDADVGQSLSYSVENLPDGLTLDPATGIISGTPSNDSALLNGGAYSVVATAMDNSGSENSSVTAAFNLNVNNLNDNPTVESTISIGTVSEDNALEISVNDLLTGIQDIDGDTLAVANITMESGDGVLSVTDDGNYVYTPSDNWHGDVTFSYVVGDGQGGQVTNTATLTVTAVNDAPVAVNDGLTGMDANSSLTLDLLANDYDVDGDVLTITGASAGHGSVTINNDGTVSYTPSEEYIGRDVISYTISDGNGGEAGSLALVNIIVGNLAPVMVDDMVVSVPENTLEVGNFAATDADGDAVSYSLSGDDANLFTIDSSGALSFVSPPDFETVPGPFSVTITATDNGIDNLSDSQTLTVSVSDVPENTAPVLGVDVAVEIAENTTVIGNFAATDTEGDSITYTLSGSDAALFNIDAAGNLSLISVPDFENGPGPLEVTINASDGSLTSTQTITINITDVNEAPLVTGAVNSVTSENAEVYSLDLLSGASDPDNADTLSISGLNHDSGDASGVVVSGDILEINPAAYTGLAAGENEVISYSYSIEDGNGGSVAQTATITIAGANDGPSVYSSITSTATEDDGTYSVNLLAGALDSDSSDVLSVTGIALVSGDASGIIVNGSSLDVDPSAYNSLASGESEVITYHYTIEDGNGGSVAQTATITINGANDGPDITSSIVSSASEDSASYSVDLLNGASDPDSFDILSVASVVLTSGDASGITINDNLLDINPNAYNSLAVGESEVITYSYTVEDGNGGSVAQTATITITGANDGPSVSSAVTLTASEDDGGYSIDLLTGASDPDISDTLNVSGLILTSGDASGITTNGNSLDIDPNVYNSLAVGESEVITYSYTVEDGNGGSIAQNATVTITGTNDGPSVAGAVVSNATENTAAYSLDLLVGSSDPDASDTLTVTGLTLTGGDDSGVSVNGNNLDIDPSAYASLAEGEVEVIEYTYMISDGNGGNIAQTAAVTITGQNGNPTVAEAVTSTSSEDSSANSVNLLTGASDPDASDTLSVAGLTLTGGDASGITVNGNSLDVNPGAYNSLAVGESEIITYSYSIEDGNGGSVNQTATITITGENDGPSVGAAVASTASEDDGIYSVNLLAGTSDLDTSDILNINGLTLTSGDGSGVTVNGNSLDINPNTYNALAVGESEVITYSYTIEDGNGGSVAQTATITITGANDGPSINSAVTSFASEDAATYSLDLLADASDPDSSDVLNVTGLTHTGGDASGITINGNSLDINPNAYNGLAVGESETISYIYNIEDGNGGSIAQTATITVTGANDAPLVASTIVSNATENTAAYSLDLLAGSSDVDASDTLTVTGLTLIGGNDAGVTVNGGNLDIDPSVYANLADGETEIIEYSYTITDSNGGTVAQAATIIITGANDDPVISGAVTSVASEDDANYAVDLLVGASDPDSSDTLSVTDISLTGGDASGITINGNSLEVDPNAYNNLAVGESETITYNYTVEDDNGGSIAQTVTITITGANDAPTISSTVTTSTLEDAASYSVDLLNDASDSDISDVLNVAGLTLTGGDASGITVNGNSLDIDPSTYNALAMGESEIITYSYTIEDGNGGSIAQTATITITGENDGPSVSSAVSSTASEEDASYSIDLLADASDPDASDSLSVVSVSVVSGDASGITVNGNSLDIDPAAYNSLTVGESEIITYNYLVEDGNGGSIAQTAMVTVTGANDGPSVTGAVVSSATENTAAYSLDLLAGSNDPDTSDTLAVTELTLNSGDDSGVSVNGNNLDVDPSFYASLADGEVEVIEYSYTITDGNGGSITQSATITITGGNGNPVISGAVSSTVSEDSADYSLDLLADASDPDASDVLNVTGLTLTGGNASGVTVNGNSLNINPNAYNALAAGESEVITYNYTIDDGSGGSVAQTATITITGANDGPSVGSAVISSVSEDASSYSVNLLAGASDPDSADVLNVAGLTLISGDASGVTVNGNSLQVNPNAYNNLAVGESEVISYSYMIEDGNGGTVAQTATITVNGENDGPGIGSTITSTTSEDDAAYSINLLTSAIDPDTTDVLNISGLTLTDGNASGVTLNGSSLDINPNAYNALAAGEIETVTYSYTIEDGNGGSVAQTATITITGTNDAPTVAGAVVSNVSEDGSAYSVDLLAGAADFDSSDILNITGLTLTGGDASGITVNGNSLDIDPSAYDVLAVGESEIITYSYTVEDGNGGSVVQTAAITIIGANDGPGVSSAVTSTVSEDNTAYSIDLLAGSSDPDVSDILSIDGLTLTGGDASGITVNGNSLDVNPNIYNGLAAGQSEVITYSYTIEDGNGGSAAQTATITIAGANDGPSVNSAVTSTISEDDGAYSVGLLAGASDPDATDVLIIAGLTLTGGDASGVTVNGNSLDINPNAYNSLAAGETEVITYSYTIEDGNGGSIAQAATITITGANDAPSVTSAVVSSASENTAAYSLDLLAGSGDVDASDTLTVTGLTLTSGDDAGIIVSGNSLDVDPGVYASLADGETEVIEYSYTITDGNGGSVAQTATITITGGNGDPIVSGAVTSSASENAVGYSVDLLSGASDPDTSDTLSVAGIVLVSGDASGIAINGNSLDVDPGAYNSLAVGESEVVTYSYTVEDGNGGSVSQTATVTIIGANDAPSVSAVVTSSASEDTTAYSVNLLNGASDPDGSDVLNIVGLTLTGGNAYGITVNGNSLDIDPSAYDALAAGESEIITYSYAIEDGSGGSVAQTATITIAGTNDAPIVAGAVVSNVSEDDAAYTVNLLAGASDSDSSDILNVTGLTLAGGDASGVTINGNSLDVNLSAYNNLAAGESEVITYNFTIEDGNGGSVFQTATITIVGANDGPSVSSAVTSIVSEADDTYSVDLLAGASDPDASDRLSITGLTVTDGDASGIIINGNSLDVNPSVYNSLAVGESETITYSYSIEDGNGGLLAQTATITITGENDGPNVSSVVTSSASEDTAAYSLDLLTGASDPDGTDSLSTVGVSLISGDDSGVTINGNSLDINPNAYNSLAVGESESISYGYAIEDGNGDSVAQTATITISGANDGPNVGFAVTSTASEDGGVYSVDLLTGAFDPDATDVLNVTGLTLVGGDTSGVTVNGNSLDINPNAYNSLAVGESEVITYNYAINDGNGGSVAQTAIITIMGANDGPSVSSTVTSTVSEDDIAYSVDLLAGSSDPDASDILNIAGLTYISGDASGITVNGNFLDVNPNAYNSLAVGESEVISYSYTIEDGDGGSVAQTATITITGANDGPSVTSAVVSNATENAAAYSLDLLAGLSDPDTSDTLFVTGLTLNSGDDSGVSVNGNNLNVDPGVYASLADGEVEVIEYSYTITDGNGGSVTQSATITITGGNGSPVVSGAVSSTASEDNTDYSLDLLAGASDPDASDTVSVAGLTLTGGDASGITVNGSSLDVNPSAYNNLAVGEFEIVTYSYTIEDGNGGSVNQTATITITGQNDAPSVGAVVASTASEDDGVYSVDLLAGASDPDSNDTLSVIGLTLTSGDASGVAVNGNSLNIDPSAYNSLADGESEVVIYSYMVVDGNGGSTAQTATITVTGANDDPTVGSAVTSTASEDATAYSIDLLNGATDQDSTDVLNISGLTLTGGDASGITFNGNLLDIDPGAYNDLAVGESEVITYNYAVEDNNGGSVAQTATITITGANDGPSVSSAVTLTASEDDAGYSIDLLTGASDPDTSDTLNISGLILTGGDAFGITVNGNSLDVDPNVHNSLAVGENQVITYSYTVEDGNGGSMAQSATITVTGANDGPNISSAVTSVTSEDNGTYSLNLLTNSSDPDGSDVLSVTGVTLLSGDATGITVNGNNLDIDPSAYASLADGEVEVIEYTYMISDGNGGNIAQTATVTITGQNGNPTVAEAVTSTSSEDGSAYSVNLLTGGSDPDASDTLSVAGLTLTSGDASDITVNGNSLDVNPGAYNSLAVGESEIITYSYSIEDGNGGSVNQTATITITGENDGPSVGAAVASTASEDDGTYSVDLLAGASDPDVSDTLNVVGLTLTGGDASGVTVNGNSLDIDTSAYNSLATGESEVITYNYTVEDGNGGSISQTATVTVTGENDGPTVGSAVTSTASEDDGVYSVNLLAGASDLDTSDILNITGLTLTGGDASGVTINGNSLEINPNAYNALAAGESKVITYSYTIEDGNGSSIAQTATITVTGANDGPSINSAVTSSASEDAATYSLDLLADASDPDNPDVLNVTGLTHTSGDASGITLNGNSLDINPNAYNDLGVGESETITYSYNIEDGNGGSIAQTATITVTGANDAPTVSAAVISSASEDDAAYSVNLLNGASDPDSGDMLNVAGLTLTSGDASGIIVNGNSLDINPGAYNNLAVGESEVITYSYTVEDGNGGSIARTATITVTGVNDAPTIVSTVVSNVSEDDTAHAIDLLTGALDSDGSDTLTVTGLTLTSGDASGITAGVNSLNVDPNAYNHLTVGQSEVISYSYTIEDGNGGSVTQTATITIAGANDGPLVSSAVTSTASENDSAYSIDLLTAASDPDSTDILTVAGVVLTGGDASGITVDGSSLDVDPSVYHFLAVGESEVVTYSYTVEDGNGGSIAQTATITITGANDGPSISAAVTSTASEDDTNYSVDLLAGASDSDASDSLSAVAILLVSGDASGITINGSSLDVDPNAYNSLAVGESEVIAYSYTIEDGNGGSVAQTATITITGGNDGPSVSSAVTSTTSEDDSTYSINLLAGTSDPDASDILTVTGLTLTSGDASGITVIGNSLDVNPGTYNNLAVGESEVITYNYTIEDGNGSSVAQTVTLTVTGANDSPSVGSAITSTASEDTAAYSVDLLAGASDPDSSDTLSVAGIALISGDASGISVSGNSLDVNPNAYSSLAVGESEIITYGYSIEDGNGGSVAQTVTITIIGANNSPSVGSAIASAASEDDSAYSVNLLAGAADSDASDTLNIAGLTLTGGNASGVIVNGNALDVNPNAYNYLAAGESEIITYSYTVEDGNGGATAQTATITITGANDSPTVGSAVTSTASEDAAAYSVDLLASASDPDDPDVLTISGLTLTGGDASGIAVNGNSLDVNPNAYNSLAVGESEIITYAYTVEDDNGGSVAQTATITITGSNDGPSVGSAVTSIASEDNAAYSIDLLAGASDPDSADVLNISGLTLTGGNDSGITVNGNSLDIDPNAYDFLAAGESEAITYSYTVEDDNGGSVAQTATITLAGSNDGPSVSSAVASTVLEDDVAYSIDLLAGASDPDTTDTVNVAGLTLTGGDASGITVNGNSLDVDPTAYNFLAMGESEIITYSYFVEDGNGGSVAQTATITVTGANDSPIVSSAVMSTASEDASSYSVNLLAGASDPDASDTLSITGITLVNGDASGITVNGNSLDVDPGAYNNLAVGESEVITYDYTIEDGNGGSIAQTATITINGANDGPLIDLDLNNSTAPDNNYQTTYTEGGSAVRIADTDISIADIDSTQLQSATITITNVEAGDLLSAGTLPAGIAASAYNPATGTITLTGSASQTAYQAAIRAIQFSNDGSASGSSRNIDVAVNDGSDDSNVATTTINMVLVPTVSITDVSVQEPSSGTTTLVFTVSIDQVLAGDLTFNYNTADISATGGADYVGVAGSAGTIIAGTTSTTVSITVNSDVNNFEGDETFAVNLSGFNQTVNFQSGAHTIAGGVQGIGTIGANNGAPDAVDDSFITSEGTPLITGNVFSNDSLVDNADYSSHDAVSDHGTITYNGNGTFTYTPNVGFSGTDSFTYSVIDDDGETDTATVTVDVTDAPVNPPVVAAVPDTVYTENDSPQSLLSGISLSDIDSATLSSVVVRVDGYIASQDALDYLTAGTSVNASVAASGNTWELTLTGGVDINEYLSVLGSLTYENLSENPSTAGRTITVEAYDEDYNNLFDSDTGTITVIAENDAPAVSDSDTFYVSNSVNNNLNITAPFDVDTDDVTLVITVTGLPTSVGIVTLADGTPVNVGNTLTLAQLTSLQLDAGATDGADTFTYTVFDGELTTAGTTTINVGDSEPDVNTVYESALDGGTGIDGGSITATGNLFSNDAAADGSTTLDSIEYNGTPNFPDSGVITIATDLGTLIVYADNSSAGFSAGDYEYVLNSADGSGVDINESFTYNFTSGVSIQDTLTITVIDDQPIANDLVEDIPESEEQVFNLVFTLDISTSMNAEVGSTGLSRLDLAKQSLVALAREYFDQSTHVNLTVMLFANGAHILGSYDNFSDAEQAITGVTDNSQTDYSNDLGWGNLSDSTSYNDALALIEQQLTADLASQNPADEVRNISYFLSDGAITADGSPVGSGFDGFVNSNSIDSYSVGIGTGLPGDLTDLNFIHNIDSLGQGNGHVDDALIVSDVSLLESELLSTVPTAFGGNITVDGSISNVEFGADGGFVSSINLELDDTPYSFTYDGTVIAVPGALTDVDVDGSKITFNSDDGFSFGTFTFDFSDGSYLFIAPNGTAGSTFNFDFTVLDGDGDIASATATIDIADDRPDARDDLHTVDVFETAQGNVVTGIGTDGGPKLGTGFTAFASQGGGVDKVVDNATVTEFSYKGTVISLELGLVDPPAPTGTSADVAVNNSTTWANIDFSLSSPSGVGYNSGGAGVADSTIDDDDSDPLTITFDEAELPYGVDNLVLGLNDYTTGFLNYFNDAVAVTVYDISGNVLGVINHNATDGTNVDLSGFSGVGAVDINYTGNFLWGDPDAQLNNVAYDPTPATPLPSPSSGTNGTNLSWDYSYETDLDGNGIFQATVTDSNDGSIFVMRGNGYYEYANASATGNTLAPVLVDYILTDSDGQSDTAQLAIHTTDNQITGTVGADSISGGSMNDAIFGDAGDDILSGGAGHDTISGGAGVDIISGNAGSDYLSGGDGNDEVYGGADNDHLAGDAGNDLLDGGLGDDIAIGGEGNDLIFGGAGNDRLEGGAGDDTIYGGAGDDTLFGDDGDDIIFGGTGNDILTGGDNMDTFVWQVTDAGSIDTITDFESGAFGDTLDFSDLLQGENADAVTLDSYFTITSDGTDTTLEIDIDGDSSGIDMTVVLQGVDLSYLGSEQQILQQLLDDGNLITD